MVVNGTNLCYSIFAVQVISLERGCNMKQSFWNMLMNKRYALFYLERHFRRSVKLDRMISIFLAITASSAIGSWVIWKELSLLWAVIVAASQVVTVINAYLPYKKRIKQINDLKNRLTPIYLEIESKWFDVNWGKLDDKEINKLHYDLAKKWEAAEAEFFADDSLPEDEKFMQEADELCEKYVKDVLGGKPKKSKPVTETNKAVPEAKQKEEKLSVGIEAVREILNNVPENEKPGTKMVVDVLEGMPKSVEPSPVIAAMKSARKGRAIRSMRLPTGENIPEMPEF